jgi:hypothetical protein
MESFAIRKEIGKEVSWEKEKVGGFWNAFKVRRAPLARVN